MGEVDEFLESMLPRMMEVDTAFHKGDPAPRGDLWSHNDPVTLLGAAVTTSGWTKVSEAFDWLAANFSNFESSEYEVIAADVSGDLAYVVCIERTVGSFRGSEVRPYALRVTTIFRREGGEWKVVHRHADSFKEPAPPDDEGAPA